MLILSNCSSTESKSSSFFSRRDSIARWLLFSIILTPLYSEDSSCNNQVVLIQLGKSVIPISFSRVASFLIAFANSAILWKSSIAFVEGRMKIASRSRKPVFLYRVWNFFHIEEQLDKPCTWNMGSTVMVGRIAPSRASHIVFRLARSVSYCVVTLGLFSLGLVG